MLGEKGLGEVHQIGNDFVVSVRPEGGKLEAVAGLFALVPVLVLLLDVAVPGGVGVIFCVGTVGDHEDLHILIQTAGGPKAVPLVPLDLVEGLPDGHAPALEFHMDQGQTVDQNGHIVACVVPARALFILVDDLQTVVVDVLFVQQIDVFGGPAVLPQHLHVVGLYAAGLFQNAVVGSGDAGLKEAVPFAVGEGIMVEQFQLAAEVGDEFPLTVDGEIFIALPLEQADELLLQCRLALVAVRPAPSGVYSATTVLSLVAAMRLYVVIIIYPSNQIWLKSCLNSGLLFL